MLKSSLRRLPIEKKLGGPRQTDVKASWFVHLIQFRSIFITDNKGKVFYGLLKEPDLQFLFQADEDDDAEGTGEGDRPKKKKTKKDSLFSKKAKTDPNAPPNDRMPLPELYVFKKWLVQFIKI